MKVWIEMHGKAPITANRGSVLDDYVGYHLRRASILDLNAFARALADENIKQVPFAVLCMIDEDPGITAAEIARLTGLQRANLAPMLAELEGRGLVDRLPDREDHRVQRLHLTAEGAASLARWRERVLEHEGRLLRNLTEDEQATLRRLLAKVWKPD